MKYSALVLKLNRFFFRKKSLSKQRSTTIHFVCVWMQMELCLNFLSNCQLHLRSADSVKSLAPLTRLFWAFFLEVLSDEIRIDVPLTLRISIMWHQNYSSKPLKPTILYLFELVSSTWICVQFQLYAGSTANRSVLLWIRQEIRAAQWTVFYVIMPLDSIYSERNSQRGLLSTSPTPMKRRHMKKSETRQHSIQIIAGIGFFFISRDPLHPQQCWKRE